MNAKYLYQKVAGSRARPQGVLPGYFKTADEARRHHERTTGYVRRVKVPADLPVEIWAS